MIPMRGLTETGDMNNIARRHSPTADTLSLSSPRVPSPQPSIISYNSARDKSRMFKETLGRSFNAMNLLYALPADEAEFSRMDKQHLMLLVAVGGLYVAKDAVQRALAPADDVQRRILDLGAGGGNCGLTLALRAIAMGQEFPNAEVVGVDLAPSIMRNPPPNVRFEFDDFGLGLPHFYGNFDLVHARCTAAGVRDYNEFIAECIRCLRPGGVLLLVEGDMTLFGENLQPILALDGQTDGSGSSMARILYEAGRVMEQRGSSMDSGRKFKELLSGRTDLVNVGCEEVFTNVGPWKQGATTEVTAHYNMIGELMRQNARAFVLSLRILLIQSGFPHDRLDQLIAATNKELDALGMHLHTLWHYAWAGKAALPAYDGRDS